MHRFVALAAPSGFVGARSDFLQAIRDRASGWPMALDSERLEVWVLSSPSSRLAFRQISEYGVSGCLVGRDFEREDPGAQFVGDDTLLRRHWGAYVAIRVDPASESIRVLRDPTGRINCWKYSQDGVHLFFSHLDDVIDVIGQRLNVNWPFLLFHSTNRTIHGRGTGFVEITEVMPGEEITLSKTGIGVKPAWNMLNIRRQPFGSISDAHKAVRIAAEQAVANWSQLYSTITLDLSGGLDSAIILGLLRQSAHQSQVVGVNYVIDHAEGDERQFARDAAEFHAIELIEVDMREARERPDPQIANRLLRPGLHLIPLGYDQAGIQAAQAVGADAFFTGTGGDHLFHHNMTPAVLIDHFRAEGIRGLVQTAHSSAQICRTTIWDPIMRLTSWLAGRRPAIESLIRLDHELLHQGGVSWGQTDDLIDPTLLNFVNSMTPAEIHQLTDMIELQSHYWRFGRADVVEEVHPFLSQPLMEAVLRTRMHWFAYEGTRRSLAKTIFTDLVPPSILNRRSKSSNSSHWVATVLSDLDTFRALLLEGRLSANGLLRRDAVERALTPLGLIEGKHFTELMNIISVERWLQTTGTIDLPTETW
ncbi:asparagine synthetase B family protein [Sphingomonas sp. YL-JM2C]